MKVDVIHYGGEDAEILSAEESLASVRTLATKEKRL